MLEMLSVVQSEELTENSSGRTPSNGHRIELVISAARFNTRNDATTPQKIINCMVFFVFVCRGDTVCETAYRYYDIETQTSEL